jgi:hypothetical protein
MELDLIFYLKIFTIILFTILFLVSLILVLKSKKGFKKYFVLIALGSLFCILNQALFFIKTGLFLNFVSIFEAVSMLIVGFASLFFLKKFTK